MEYYEKVASEYERKLDNLFFKVYDDLTWRSIEPILQRAKDGIVLDVARGTGRWSMRIAESGVHVILLDFSKSMLREARKKGANQLLRPRLTLLCADAEQIPFPSDSFDVVICEHSLHVISDIEKAISEISRVAKPGGIVVATMTGTYHKALVTLREDAVEAMNILRGKSSGFYKNWLSPNEFLSLIRNSGLLVEKTIGKGFSALTVPETKLFSKTYSDADFQTMLQFEEALSNRPDALGLASHIQVVARKVNG